jgi:hypothetical protein
MTVDQKLIVRGYIGDLIAVMDHVSQAVSKHAGDESLRKVGHAGEVIDAMNTTLVRQLADLRAHVKDMGGATGGGVVKDVLASMTGALAGLYGKARGETVSRMLRDDYTALSFLSVCTIALHTTALALNDTLTMDLTLRHLREYPSLMMSLSDLLPYAVVAELAKEAVPITNAEAAEQAVHSLRDAWRRAPAPRSLIGLA